MAILGVIYAIVLHPCGKSEGTVDVRARAASLWNEELKIIPFGQRQRQLVPRTGRQR